MARMKIISGDDVSQALTLKKGAEGSPTTFTINSGATVEVSLTTLAKRVIIPAIPVLESTVGSNWANSLIVINLPSTATALIPDKLTKAILEIQVNDSGKQTWFLEVDLQTGTIN